MSDVRRDEESDLLAAEYVIGLLDGDALRDARRRVAVDPDFADAVAWWQEWLAPLLDEIAEATPGPEMRARILRAIADAPRGGDNVVALDRTARRWRAGAVAMTAVAASLALLLGYEATREVPPPVQPPAWQGAPVLVATLAATEARTSLAVAYDPRQSSLLVSPGHLTAVSNRDLQLWIIPEGGTPLSLGLIQPGAPLHLPVDAALAARFRAQATIAVSVEPLGGSPTGLPTGPVIASGPLLTI